MDFRIVLRRFRRSAVQKYYFMGQISLPNSPRRCRLLPSWSDNKFCYKPWSRRLLEPWSANNGISQVNPSEGIARRRHRFRLEVCYLWSRTSLRRHFTGIFRPTPASFISWSTPTRWQMVKQARSKPNFPSLQHRLRLCLHQSKRHLA